MNSCHVLQDSARIRGLPVKSRLQPHDRFACESLADPELARQFLHCFLPPDVSAMLSFDGLRRENADFIDEKLKEHRSDLFRRRDLKFVERLLSYVYNVHDYQATEIRDIIEEEIGPEEGGIAMTTVQKLIQEGLEQGLEQGIKQARLEDARNLLKNGVPLKVVIKSIGLSEEELRKEGILK